VSLLTISKRSRLLDLKTRKLSLKRLSEKSRSVRKLLLPKRPVPTKVKELTRTPNKKLKTRLPKKLKRRQSQKRNDTVLFNLPQFSIIKHFFNLMIESEYEFK